MRHEAQWGGEGRRCREGEGGSQRGREGEEARASLSLDIRADDPLVGDVSDLREEDPLLLFAVAAATVPALVPLLLLLRRRLVHLLL